MNSENFYHKILNKNKQLKKTTYNYKGYQLKGWWCYPFIIPLVAINRHIKNKQSKKWKSYTFSEEKANEIIDKYLFKVCDYEPNENILIYYTGWDAHIWVSKVKKKDKLWCNKFKYEIVDYLVNNYNIKNVSKIIQEDDDGKWIYFGNVSKNFLGGCQDD